MNNRTIAIFGLLVFAFLSCREPETGISPVGAVPEIPPKRLKYNSLPVEFICHIDLERSNPLNVKDYYFGGQGAPEDPVFDYAVFGHAYLVKDNLGYVHIKTTPALQYVLNNNKTFIKPLREKGIKILIEVRSGNYAPEEAGVGLGLGTLDMATIEESRQGFRLLVDRYGIDGFELNDIGGGYKSYPPYTRNLKQFQKDTPMYPDSLFKNKDGEFLSEGEITAILWREGGSNFSNFIYKINETLKVSYHVGADYGSADNDNQIVEITRPLLVLNNGHGGSLIANIRNEYMPDAYSGATASVVNNMKYFVNDFINEIPHTTKGHPHFFDEATGENTGIYAADRYGPFAVDLSDRLSTGDAAELAQWFTGSAGSPNRYGALYFSNLPSVSQAGSESTLRTYLTVFTQELFGRNTRLYEGGGNYPKTW
jgi:hypothetical protein